MRVHRRLTVLVSMSVAMPAAMPTRAADSVLPPPSPRISLGADSDWQLRQPEPVLVPAERRMAVRIVYPALVTAR